jgi:hypothetical protein
MPNQQTYFITFSSPEYKNLGEFLADPNSPVNIYVNNADDFLKIIGDDKLTNRKRIESFYKTPDDRIYIGADAIKLPVKLGTVLYLEYSKVNAPSFITEGIEVVSNDEVAFKAQKLAELESDRGYVALSKPIAGKVQNGSLQQMYPELTVWIWCRSLSSKLSEDELEGELFDLTPFIINCSTNMGKNGGNFQITLPPLLCELDNADRWVLKKQNLNEYNDGTGYLSEASLYSGEKNDVLQRNQFLFSKIIRSNDLVFIRFETLQIEREQRYRDAYNYFINKTQLAGRIYDMIGLVDAVPETITPANNDVTVNINGRDLSKLFIEDGTYFYALENSQGILKVAGDTRLKNSLIARNFSDGGLKFLGLYFFTSIEYILKFMINQLANIKIVPDDLFISYGAARNFKFNEIVDNSVNRTTNNTDAIPNNNYKPQFKKELASGIWQIVKLVIDKGVIERRLADSSFSTANGSLLNFVHSACQQPFVEFYMDTYKDMYHLIVRKPPFDQKALLSLIEGKVNTETGEQVAPVIIDIEAEDVLKEMLMMDDSQVYSWYHVFPKNAQLNSRADYSTSILPAIFFEEYAQVWGSKPYQQANTYIPYVALANKNDNSFDIMMKQAFYDMKYVIETTQYLPFSRKGTLVLNRDRRLKVGNVLRYKPTGEIFFIEAVRHNVSISEQNIDATTTVQVTRGLVEQLIYGVHYVNKDGVSKYVSYFNIIDTTLDLNEKEINVPRTVSKKTGTRQVEKTIPTLLKKPLPSGGINLNNPSIPGVLNNPDMVADDNMVQGVKYLEKYNSYPENKQVFINFINGITGMGYTVVLLPEATNRSYSEQAALKKQNALNASPGHSKHEHGSAIDITILNNKNYKVYSKHTSEADWLSTGVPQYAKSLGLVWGGNNDGTFGTKGSGSYYIDRVHFEIPTAKTEYVNEDVYENVTEYVKQKTLDYDGVFSKFKVNKFSFNFFLKNLQFSTEYREVNNRTIYNPDGSLPDVIVKSKR